MPTKSHKREPRCDHKFIDSTMCLKCDWTPTDTVREIHRLANKLHDPDGDALRDIALRLKAQVREMKAEMQQLIDEGIVVDG